MNRPVARCALGQLLSEVTQ